FVPGVALYEHIIGALLEQGVDWLHSGRASYRFRRPVYDGEDIRFTLNADDRTWSLQGPNDDRARASGDLDVDEEAPEVPEGAVPGTGELQQLGSDPSHVGFGLYQEQALDVPE